MVDFQTALTSRPSEHRAHRGMLDFVDGLDVLYLRIDDAMFVFEKWREETAAYVAIFVDRCCQYHPTVIPIPRRIVGATAEERDSKWGARDNHSGEPRSLRRCPEPPGLTGTT